jgi:hypothetical protein
MTSEERLKILIRVGAKYGFGDAVTWLEFNSARGFFDSAVRYRRLQIYSIQDNVLTSVSPAALLVPIELEAG